MKKAPELLVLILIAISSSGCSFFNDLIESKDSLIAISFSNDSKGNSSSLQSIGMDYYSSTSSLTTILVSSNELSSISSSSDSIIPNIELPAFYFNVINPFSTNQFDYKNPDSTRVSLRRNDSYNSFFQNNDKRCYMVLSLFDSISLQFITTFDSFDEKPFIDDLIQGIKITATYSNLQVESEIVTTYFYVSKDGRFGFLIGSQTILFYTNPGAISYETVENKIREVDENYPKHSF